MNWLSNFLKALGGAFPSCKEAVRLQSQAMDRSLPFSRRVGLRLHLLYCKWCRRYGRQIAFIRSAARLQIEHDHDPDGPVLSSDARRRIKNRLQAERE